MCSLEDRTSYQEPSSRPSLGIHLFGSGRECLGPPFGAVYEDGDARQEVRQHAAQESLPTAGVRHHLSPPTPFTTHISGRLTLHSATTTGTG